MQQSNLLFGDIGGTNARIALGYFDKNKLVIEHIKVYRSADHQRFEDILSLFTQEYQVDLNRIASVCFAAAGPVKQGEVKFTNLSWNLSEENIKKHLNIQPVSLLNDFAAAGYGIHTLQAEDIYHFCGPQHQPNNTHIKSIIGAGTGLGMAHISYNNGQPVIHASEGGHVDFAPVGEAQGELFQYLNTKLNRVSIERVLSGYGIKNIYDFLRDAYYTNTSTYQSLDEKINKAPLKTGKIIHEHICDYPIAKQCQDLFLEIYAQTIANLALTTLPFGGLFVASGIAPKLKAAFNEPVFQNHMYNKGRMSGLIKDIPMHIVLDTKTGLKGAGFLAEMHTITNASITADS
jgi:glucokinase